MMMMTDGRCVYDADTQVTARTGRSQGQGHNADHSTHH
jgi:hypothetical protein